MERIENLKTKSNELGAEIEIAYEEIMEYYYEFCDYYESIVQEKMTDEELLNVEETVIDDLGTLLNMVNEMHSNMKSLHKLNSKINKLEKARKNEINRLEKRLEELK